MNLIPSILAFGFVTPWLFAAGATATSIPIVIHLLNRRRFKIVVWAAMDFLLAAQKRNARRLQFQRFLLLLLRVLALLALAAAVAQLLLGAAGLAGILGAEQRAVVIVWDDSYSMGFTKPGQPSNFDRSRKVLLDYMDTLGAADRVALLRASRGAEPIIGKATLDHKALRRAIEAQEISDGGTDLSAALDKAADLLAEVKGTTTFRQVLMVTDGSRSSLGMQNPQTAVATAENLKKAVRKVREVAKLSVLDLGENEQFNVGITALEATRPVAVAGAATELRVVVTNAYDTPQMGIPLTVQVNGVPIYNERIMRLEPGASKAVNVSLTPPNPGRIVVEARLNGHNDLLPADDVRRMILDVQKELPILVVDGSQGTTNSLRSSTFLQMALAPMIDAQSASVFSVRVIGEFELPQMKVNPRAFPVLILTDTSVPDDNTAKTLKAYVNEGGYLIIFPGPGTKPELMNRVLGDNGMKLLPAGMGQLAKVRATGDAVVGLKFDPMGYAHPILAPFAAANRENANIGLNTVQTTDYVRLTLPNDNASQMILKYTDGAPAVVTRSVGAGRVTLFASSADTSWNDFPAKPSFVPFVHELVYFGLAREPIGYNVAVGQPLQLPADVAPAGLWNGPANSKVNVTAVVDKDGKVRMTSEPLYKAGVYAPPGLPPVVAVSVDGEEADIRHVASGQYAATLELTAEELITDAAKSASVKLDQESAGNLGRNLLLVALLLLATETLLARQFSQYR
ncbi:MAG: VWA domain-containing protein [Phycisphaerae bacterium]